MTNQIARLRAQAFAAQQGHCYYCGAKMCAGDVAEFAREHSISPAQARLLKCTAEHVIAQQDKGNTSAENIVAACFTCNNRRHRRKQPLPAELHRARVQRAIARRRWHGDWLFRCTALLGHAPA